jgi:hypothetical protein
MSQFRISNRHLAQHDGSIRCVSLSAPMKDQPAPFHSAGSGSPPPGLRGPRLGAKCVDGYRIVKIGRRDEGVPGGRSFVPGSHRLPGCRTKSLRSAVRSRLRGRCFRHRSLRMGKPPRPRAAYKTPLREDKLLFGVYRSAHTVAGRTLHALKTPDFRCAGSPQSANTIENKAKPEATNQ